MNRWSVKPGVVLERSQVPMVTPDRPLSCLSAPCPDVTSGVTCVVTGSCKQGVQASGELPGCSRAEQLEAVAALSSLCSASCSSRLDLANGRLWQEIGGQEREDHGVYIVLSLEIHADAHVRGYVGEKIKLKCTFKSTSDVTDKLTIDWTYRPPSSSRTVSIFHYQSFQYPTTAGTFRDRISWVGNVYKGDASISISNPTIKDNGTFSCAVKNPPDVHHNIPMTELTVTERGFGTMLSSVALLSILVFVPSAVVVALLLVRMGRKAAGLKKRSRSGYKKSSIEVSDDTDQEEEDACMVRLCIRCAECLDSDYEETY
ncbi:myelin protein zero-like protein 3 isoform X2 [Papio anubis]|uniref:myelin protein zero-like protein 3 isoform X2 n=1 Tax=Papio anubis TaxID=9555 RepID=UPI0012AE3A89|nr:myelin protein zero-like protein 3 isoform X2 [Papio anubis]